MAELTPDDVEAFTEGRLPGSGDERTQALLDAALTAARRYCGWHVSPVETGDVVSARAVEDILDLPSLKLVELTSITQDGEPVDLSTLRWDIPTSPRPKRALVRKIRGCWPQANIVATIDHGFTESESSDWRRAVLRLVDLMSTELVGYGQRDSPDLSRKRVDDVQYEWVGGLISSDEQLCALFSQFRILPLP